MRAIKRGTTSWREIADVSQLAADEVAFAGAFVYAADGFTPKMVWDATLNGGVGNVRAMTGAEVTAAVAAAKTAAAQAAKAQAVTNLQNGAAQDAPSGNRLIVAVVQLLLDEFNRHTVLEAALNAGVQAATSLADLKTRWAAVFAANGSSVPTRTLADLQTAIIAKINATAE